jgi:hypothetical protein
MCECFQIGGRFIAEDPDCSVHGTASVGRDDQVRDILRQVWARDISADEGTDLIMNLIG